MGTTNVQICNVALSAYCGEETITALEEDSPRAEICRLHFDDTRRMLFERNWWNFAKQRQLLAQLINDRDTEWLFKYQMPADALAIHWVNDATTARIMLAAGNSPDSAREISGQSIYSDVEQATCEFTQEITDPALYPQYFADAFSAALATRIVSPITQDATRIRAAQEAYTGALGMAIALDTRNDPPVMPPVPDWMSIRGVT